MHITGTSPEALAGMAETSGALPAMKTLEFLHNKKSVETRGAGLAKCPRLETLSSYSTGAWLWR